MLTSYARLDIIEPLPININATVQVYNGMPNVRVFPYAIWKEDGKINLYSNGLSTFVEGIASPAIANDGFDCQAGDKVEVDARLFDHFDDGNIDFLDIDMEGAEWYAIRQMKSRPHVISIEMEWKAYRNPFYDEIVGWMEFNGYVEFGIQDANCIYRRR